MNPTFNSIANCLKYRALIENKDAVEVFCETNEEDGYEFDVQVLELNGNLHLAVNGFCSDTTFESIIDICRVLSRTLIAMSINKQKLIENLEKSIQDSDLG